MRQLNLPRVASRSVFFSSSSYVPPEASAAGGVKSIPSVLNEVLTPTGVVMPKVVHRVLGPEVSQSVVILV